MKIKHYIALATAAATVAACDLDTIPEGGTVTEEQKEEVVADNPEKISSDVNALKSTLTQTTIDETGVHSDFGFPSIALTQDCAGQDMVSEDHGYNWFSTPLIFRDRIPTSTDNSIQWKLFYKQIKTANDLLKTLYGNFEESERVGQVADYIGQALANRAFSYLELIQLYQFTYQGHEEALGLPIVDENTSMETAVNNPRATVREVYNMIRKDLDDAIGYLENSGIARTDKAQINAAVAHGLRARVGLLVGEYAQAAEDAQKALDLSGATPYSMEEVSVPSFNDAGANSWIWGIIITSESDVVQTGIVNWPSHLCTLTGNGYTTGVGVPVVLKRINSALFAKINDSDVRKSWWMDENLHTQALVNAYEVDGQGLFDALGMDTVPYVNVKFGPEGNVALNPQNAQDWPLMRAEEMLLVKAEALARSGNVAEGKKVLEDFLKEYRDPEYSCQASGVEEFVDEVWIQRRIELWGEGFSLKDILRLKKPIDRTGTNFSGNVTFRIEAEDPILIYNIPECETNTNKGIPADQINTIATPPAPIG